MDDAREAFLAGERLDDIVIYLADDTVDDPDRLREYGHRVEDGLVLVLDGETGRQVFQTATGMGAMAFAKTAMETTGEIDRDLTGGECPNCEDGTVRVLLAFAEGQNEEVGGQYGEGDVIHAYAQCSCGTAYSQRWVAGTR